MTVEKKRMIEDRGKIKNWRKFGPYLASHKPVTGNSLSTRHPEFTYRKEM